jgi:hypothetical protein
MLHKSFGLDVKAVSAEGVDRGLRQRFRRLAGFLWRHYAPGAFSDTLTQHKRSGTMPLMLWGHDASTADRQLGGHGAGRKGPVGQRHDSLEDPMGVRVHGAS